MFNLYDNPAVSDWFRRFDAASRHLPAEERVSQREEIQQHLVGLVAANMALGQPNEEAWKAALKQFGDPTQIGRRIDQEWQQGRTGPSADKDAIRYAAGHIGCYFAYFLIPYALRDICLDGSKDLIGFAPLPTAVYLIYAFGGAIPVGVLIGRNRPLQAVRAAFYASLVWAC